MPLPASLEGKLRIPVIGAPLFIISVPDLVVAQCTSGIVGSFPALNARPAHKLREWIREIKDRCGEFQEKNPDKKVAPFAVNHICHSTNDRLGHDIQVTAEEEVPIIITSLRPPEEVVTATHSYGGVVFHDVINTRHAKKAQEQGVDGLILVGSGAGGHAGSLNPIAFVHEVRSFFPGTILLSGAMSTGAGVAAAIAMGADLAYLGTRFIATKECAADQNYKQGIVDSGAEEIVYTNLFSGVHGNYLTRSITAAGLDPANLPVSSKENANFGSGGSSKAKVWRDIWGGGQSVGAIKSVEPTAVVVDELATEFEASVQNLHSKFG